MLMGLASVGGYSNAPLLGRFCWGAMFGPKTHCVVVVGAQWGDEGKGKIVDVLAERADLVVRYQGGANAGHTVHTGAGEFVLHQLPSASIQGAVCLVGNGVVLDPETLFTELDALSERGIRTEHKLYVSDRAHLTLPFHKLLDRAREAREKIGTTGRGIGPTYEDKFGRRGIRVGDLRNLGRAKELACARVQAANEFLELLGSTERADSGEHVGLLERLAPRLLPLAVDAGRVVWEALERGESVLLEGAQGALLDVDHGTYPYVTSSNTTAGGAAVGAGIGPTAIDAVLGVVKAYTTRVGNGPLPTEAEPALAERVRELGGEFGATTGRPRRCGWFDAVVVRYAVRVNGLTGLAVTKLDVLDSFPEIPVGVGYRLDGEIVDSMPAGVEPTRREALGYYRKVAEFYALDVRLYHVVTAFERVPLGFELTVRGAAHGAPARVRARNVVFATGYFDSPNPLGVPGEDLPHVSHFFTEAHPYWRQSVVVVGGGNSAVEAALELHRVGARVTIVHFLGEFDRGVKPWVLPDITNRVKDRSIAARWLSRVVEIRPREVIVRSETDGAAECLPADFVLAMTGYRADLSLLRMAGVTVDEKTGVPQHDPATMQTNVPGVFIAGVLASGLDANRIFIENGRAHGGLICGYLKAQPPRVAPGG